MTSELQNITRLLEKVTSSQDLLANEARWVMTQIMEGALSQSQMAAILIALRMKGETVAEITEFAKVMREKSTKIPIKTPQLIDTCGTGGDSSGSFNISTTVALLLAGGGYKIAKHGNRSMTSKSGSADVLEALGIKIDLSPQQAADCIEECGFGFLFAPALHSSMKNVVPVRKELAIRTIFNILGPLTNPANANIQVMGLFSTALVSKIARVNKQLGMKAGYIFSGKSGLDEVCIADDTVVARLMPSGEIREFIFNPEEFGFNKSPLDQIKGGDPLENAEITKDILSNSLTGPKRDIVKINAAFAISTLENNEIKEALDSAEELLTHKAGMLAIEKLKQFTNG